jgi:hypothetical protein
MAILHSISIVFAMQFSVNNTDWNFVNEMHHVHQTVNISLVNYRFFSFRLLVLLVQIRSMIKFVRPRVSYQLRWR